MELGHGELDVGLEGHAPAAGVAVHQLEEVVALDVPPLGHRLSQHLHLKERRYEIMMTGGKE